MILITSIYETGNDIRDMEFVKCLTNNKNNPYINKIILAFEGDRGSLYEIVKEDITHQINTRPSFDDLINLYDGNDIVILANADIYFDNTIQLVNDLELNNTLIMLTRKNLINGKLRPQTNDEMVACADVWIYKSPTKINCDCQVGVAYCDGKISAYAHRDGFKVLNYSKSINAIHIHKKGYKNSQRRNRRYKGQSLYTQQLYIGQKVTKNPELRND